MNNQDSPVIIWFRNDLRLADHAALQAAVAEGRPVLPLYVLDECNAEPWSYGAAGRWWLHHSLSSLRESLNRLGGELCLRRGDPSTIIPALLETTGARALYFSRGYEPWEMAVELRLCERLLESAEVKRFPGALLFEPEWIKSAAGEPYKVFTPFWNACRGMPEPRACLPAPSRIRFYRQCPESEDLDSWRLLPKTPDWAGGLRQNWRPGEAAAHESLDDFLQTSLATYATDRDRPDRQATSRLSPHLHFGELSPRSLWHAVRSRQSIQGECAEGAEVFLRELGWREFNRHLLFHWPELPQHPFRENFTAFPWKRDEELLRAWQRGETGYPIVDAGMRELWRTGWMHNRVRMICASFLVKDLLQPWQDGEAWFWDTLVDADLANNAGGWQWVAGCGADAAPYFRIFNPVLQAQKFDPDGFYVKRWLPELSALPPQYVHQPWNSPKDLLQRAGLELGRDYPLPLIDHGVARQRALASLQSIKSS